MPNGAAYDYFGESVALYEDTIVVGASIDSNDNRWQSGSAHVFVRSGEEWTHQAKLLAPDGAAGDYFGDSVAIYKDTIVVSSPFDDDNKQSAHVFVRSGDEWIHQTKLLTPDGEFHDLFGESVAWESVAIYQDTIVVVASGDDGNGNISCPAHVFVVRVQTAGAPWCRQECTASVVGKSPTKPPDQAEIPRAQADGERPDARLDP
ncbi:hypothetical protein THAOC_29931, partial [Thalassiosira oceanica]